MSNLKNYPKPNDDIRSFAKQRNVPLWMVSERCGYRWSNNFSAYLRTALSDDEKQRLFSIIDEIAAELKGGDGE